MESSSVLWLPTEDHELSSGLVQQIKQRCKSQWRFAEWFQTTVGVIQGCVIPPQLFNILLEVVMLYATHNVKIGAKIQGQLISNLRFADGIVIFAESANDLQNLVEKNQHCKN